MSYYKLTDKTTKEVSYMNLYDDELSMVEEFFEIEKEI